MLLFWLSKNGKSLVNWQYLVKLIQAKDLKNNKDILTCNKPRVCFTLWKQILDYRYLLRKGIIRILGNEKVSIFGLIIGWGTLP